MSRFRHADGTTVHIAYSTNVHAAEDLDGIIEQLSRYCEPVRREVDEPSLGLGLWLAHDAAEALVDDPDAVKRLRRELGTRGLEVVTFNGFPYKGFHDKVVKRAVYKPDWSEYERLSHTIILAKLLSMLMPDDVLRGSVSTVPLGWRVGWSPDMSEAARKHLGILAEELDTIALRSGHVIRVAFEPEPGCVVETTTEAVRHLSGLPDTLGITLDTCHLAVAFEEPREALKRLSDAEIPIVKLQASCALEADHLEEEATRAALSSFIEPRFLHQTREFIDYHVEGRDDLDEALSGPHSLPEGGTWRTHFHIPLHADPKPPLSTTRPILVSTLQELLGGPQAGVDQVEIETYTWSVLPAELQPVGDHGLVVGLAEEMKWMESTLEGLGLKRGTS